MLKETRTYIDFNEQTRTEDFFFHLSKAEILEMELSMEGGLSEYATKISKTQDGPKLVALFKELVLKAYGEKSLDGKYFEKTEEITRRFSQTQAYSDIFMELATNAEAASRFINGIVPKDMAKNLPSAEEVVKTLDQQ